MVPVMSGVTFSRAIFHSFCSSIYSDPPLYTLPTISSATIEVSRALESSHPALRPTLKDIINEQQLSAHIKVTVGRDNNFNAVSFLNVPGLQSNRQLTLLWLDEGDADLHVALDTLSGLVEAFRRERRQKKLHQRTIVLTYGIRDDHNSLGSRNVIDEAMCRLELVLPCMRRSANSVTEAASQMFLMFMVTLILISGPRLILKPHSPSPFLRQIRRNMLITLPGMTEERVDLVLARYPNLRHLWMNFMQMRLDVKAGRVALNSSLFIGERNDGGETELWVRNLFLFFTDKDGDGLLYTE
ncbi:hypothetical protein PM082_015515 [Marasmius tenuissimus]|nr:hypothetical protein PM082_015515 [Marasmius tenuissimus]